MPVESVNEKAERIVAAGGVEHLEVIDVDDGVMRWAVKGDHGAYDVLTSNSEDATCTCPAKARCAHITAVELYQEAALPDPEVLDTETIDQGDNPGLALIEDPVSRDRAIYRQLSVIVDTDFVPRAYRGNPAAALAAVKAGEELGIGMMESLRSIDVVNGSAEPNAELKLRMYRQAGHRLEVLEHTDEVCRLKGIRADTGDEMVVEYTIEDARRANLAGKDVWKQHPQSMNWARAVTRLVRRLAPDALAARHPE